MADGSLFPRRYGSLFQDAPQYWRDRGRKVEAWGLLDRVGASVEPTETQKDRAKTTYHAVGDWLSEGDDLLNAMIYAQGSAALGTMIRPFGHCDFDVDLICRTTRTVASTTPAALKAIVGDRLKAHGRYGKILEEMPRCWRLNFAGDFHLDITPSIRNPNCGRGGELVPDRRLRRFKPSNPTGYADLFNTRAALQPRARVINAYESTARAEVQTYPAFSSKKGVLRRTVQLLKVHRDRMFRLRDPALAPLSIIITTLAMRAYEFCITFYEYDNELDLMCDTLDLMPTFIGRFFPEGRAHFLIENETTAGENFAEKWNDHPERATAFYEWHERASAAFAAFRDAVGLDRVRKALSEALGPELVQRMTSADEAALGRARVSGGLSVTAGLGLSTGAAVGTPVKANTFFGRVP